MQLTEWVHLPKVFSTESLNWQYTKNIKLSSSSVSFDTDMCLLQAQTTSELGKKQTTCFREHTCITDPNQADSLKRNEVTPAAWKREQTLSALRTYCKFATVVGVLFLITRKIKQCSINSKIHGCIFISLGILQYYPELLRLPLFPWANTIPLPDHI